MKKLLFFAALIAVITFTSCGNGVNKLPKDLRAAIEEMDNAYKEALSDKDAPYIYKGVKVDDHNIIFTFQVSEDEMDDLDVKSLKKLAKERGGKEQAALFLALRVDAEVDAEEDESDNFDELLVEHKYNIVARFIGKDEDDVVEYKVSYKEIKKSLEPGETEKYEEPEAVIDASPVAAEEVEVAEVYDDDWYKEYLISEIERACAEGDVTEVERIGNIIDENYSEDDFTEEQMNRVVNALLPIIDQFEVQ